jgi:transmembrane sensor
VPKAPDRFQPSQTVSPPDSGPGPSVWDEALDWLLLVEAAPGDAKLRLELEHWLAKGTAQRAAFARAQEVWRLTGGIPPAHRATGRSAASRPKTPSPGARAS